MGSEGTADDDELGVQLDWPGEDTGFTLRPDAKEKRRPAEAPKRPRKRPAQAAPAPPRAAAPRTAPVPAADPPADDAGPVPLLPALFRRLEAVSSNIATLAMRVDALGATTSSLHAAFSDRLTEYVDTVAHITRSQQDSLEEYRHGNDRVVAELRRAVGESDDVLRRVAARVDEVAEDLASFGDIARALGSAPARGRGGAGFDPAAIEAELAGLRDDIVQLKRRLGVRAKATVVLDEEQVELLLDQLVERIGTSVFADDDIERVAHAVVAQLDQFLEVVPDDEPVAPSADAPRSSRRSR